MKLLDYLFYKFYKLINFLGNTEFYPEGNAWFASSMLLWLNMLTALNFIELRLERAVTNKVYVIVFYVLYLVTTFIYFFRNERYRDIINRYNNESGAKKLWGTLIVASYIIITAVLHFYFSEQRREMALRTQ